MTKVDIRTVWKHTFLELAKDHRKVCLGETCTTSLIHLATICTMLDIPLSDEEMKLLI